MVAITVVLAAVVFVLVNNLSKTQDKAPNSAFAATANSQTDVLTLRLISGDEVLEGDMEVSIVLDGSAPVYVACGNSAGNEAFQSGFQIIINTRTDMTGGVTCDYTDSGGGTLTPTVATDVFGGTTGDSGEQDYQVLVRHTGTKTLLFEKVVTLDI